MVSIIQPDDQQWDAFVRQQRRAHVLQYAQWGHHKAAFGWTFARTALTDNGQMVAGAQLLFRPLPLKLGTMAYLPMGPYAISDSLLPELWKVIDSSAKQHRAAFLKWEPGIYLNEQPPDITQWGFQSSPQTVQPPNTILIDISGDEETIMKHMNQGTRRKIRQSLKADIHYYEGTRADIAKFNSIMQTTGERNEFGVHSPEYYELAYDLFVPSGDAALFLAEHEGDVLAGVMIFYAGDTAWYLYGASSNVKRNLMASYGIQWKAIEWAQQRGCRWYDLWGIPDEDEATLEAQFQERSDDLWGVYGFKRGWGGQVVRSVGAWDKVYNSIVYSAYKLAIKARDR